VRPLAAAVVALGLGAGIPVRVTARPGEPAPGAGAGAEPVDEMIEDPSAIALPGVEDAPTETALEPDLGAPPPSEATAAAAAPAQPRTFAATFGGYVDFGFFVPRGNNGAGWIQATAPMLAQDFPQYANRYAWVFLGDILAPAVNTRGEPADLGNSPGVTRFDSVHSNGAAGFIVNEVNLSANASVLSSILATTSVNFTPRTGAAFSWGDSFDVDIAQIEWLVGARQRTSVFVGKFDSAIGIEYRERKASQRFGITPSLLARYTTGTPLGLKVRTKLGSDDQVVLTGALTNGSSVTEPFHFYDEVDSNNGKTASGRAAVRLPLPFALELGFSGLYGTQDRAFDDLGRVWFWGPDLIAEIGPLVLKGQWLRGRVDGESDRRYEEAHRPYGLALEGGGYLEANAVVQPWLGLLLRGEYRDALVWLGNQDPTQPQTPGSEPGERLYITKSYRVTVGARVTFGDRLVAKAEYLLNGEYGPVPDIRNDVFTTSCVWMY
jgi:hypothetical protein